MSDKVTVTTSLSNSTSYDQLYAKLYNGQISPVNNQSLRNDADVLSIYNRHGEKLYCEYNQNNSTIHDQFVETSVSSLSLDRGVPLTNNTTQYNVCCLNAELDPIATCVDRIRSDQEYELDRLLISGVSFSDLSPKSLEGLYGRVITTTNNNILTNTHYTQPRNCSDHCPDGQCAEPIFGIFPYTRSNTTFSTTSLETGCRRVAAVYLRSNLLSLNIGEVLTDDEVRDIEDPCGTEVACSVRSIGRYNTKLKLRVDSSRLNRDIMNGLSTVRLSNGNDLHCETNAFTDGLIPEKIVYTDGNCSEFADNECLHENSYENVKDFILIGSNTIDNDITIDKYVEQSCPENITCSFDACPTIPTEITTVSATSATSSMNTVTSITTEYSLTTDKDMQEDYIKDGGVSNHNKGLTIGAGVFGGVVFIATIVIAFMTFYCKGRIKNFIGRANKFFISKSNKKSDITDVSEMYVI